MATGVGPATGFLEGSGIELNEKDKSVEVDEYLRVKGIDGVYAIGALSRDSDERASKLITILHR